MRLRWNEIRSTRAPLVDAWKKTCATNAAVTTNVATGGVRMADINLAQDEADKLMAMEKRAVDSKDWFGLFAFSAPSHLASTPCPIGDTARR